MAIKQYRVQVKGSKTALYFEAERHEEVDGRPGDMRFYTGDDQVGEARDVIMWRLMRTVETPASEEELPTIDPDVAP